MYNTTNLTLIYNVDEEVNWCRYSLNSGGFIDAASPYDFVAIFGDNTITVQCSDTTGNIGTAQVSFAIEPTIYCGNNICDIDETVEICPMDCSLYCIDSDGLNWNVQGTATNITGNYTDECHPSIPNLLWEYYCSRNDLLKTSYDCPYICENGKCTDQTNQTHSICSANSCITVTGPGINQCNLDSDCQPINEEWFYDRYDNESHFDAPTFADIDSDGDMEIFTGLRENSGDQLTEIWAFHHDGSPVVGNGLFFDVPFPETQSITPTIADLDKNGFSEIIVGTNYNIRIFSHEGSLIDQWPVEGVVTDRYKFAITSPVVVSDLEDDGADEIIVPLFTSSVNHNIQCA